MGAAGRVRETGCGWMIPCPVCGDTEAVRAVATLHTEHVETRNLTDLARYLAPPRVSVLLPDPSYADRQETRVLLPSLVLSFLIGVAVAFMGFGFGGFLVATLPCALLGLLAAKLYAAARYEAARDEALAAAQDEERSPAHRKRQQQWEQAAYCPRDEIVYFPDGIVRFSPALFHDLMTGKLAAEAETDESAAGPGL